MQVQNIEEVKNNKPVKVEAKSFNAKFSKKKEVYGFLSVEVQCYLPDY